MRIVFYINTVTSYQDNFYHELSKKIDIKVIVLSKKYKNYQFKINRKFYQFLDKIEFPQKKIHQIISKFNPQFIIFGGYRLKYNSYINKIIKEKNIKFYYWLERLDTSKKIKTALIKIFFKKILPKADGIMAIGKEAEKFYKSFNHNVINLPYSIKFENIIRDSKIKKKKVKFLFVGQLIKRKGINIILQLFNLKKYSNCEMIIVGDGEYKNEVLKLCKKNKHVKYFNFQNKNELKKIYLSSDILIFLSKFDGWGVVALEAMNYGLLIISTNNAGVAEIIPKKNMIIDPKINKLEKKIDFILKNNQIIRHIGKLNKQSLKFSLCNSDNSIKKFLNYIDK